MNLCNEWRILVAGAQRRDQIGIESIEDQTLIEMDLVLNFLLNHVIVDEWGAIQLNPVEAPLNKHDSILAALDHCLKED